MRAFLDLLFPPRCTTCRRISSEIICPECLKSIAWIKPPVCSQCGRPLPTDRNQRCFFCQKEDFCFDRARSIGLYEGVLKSAIHHLKFKKKQALALPLGAIMAEKLDTAERGAGIILYPPLHLKKLKKRGFNHMELITQTVSKLSGLPFYHGGLSRVVDTRPQFGLSRKERLSNISGAFIMEPALTGQVAGKNILLLDDILTTGATLNELSKLLKAAGANKVYALTLTRGVLNFP